MTRAKTPSDVPSARHPERRRGIEERFLPELVLSFVEGVEMTRVLSLRAWRLGAINVLAVVLSILR